MSGRSQHTQSEDVDGNTRQDTGNAACADTEHTAEAALYSSGLEIADLYEDIYSRAVDADSLDSLETMQSIVSRLGEKGYCAADADNQINMTNS